MKSVVTFCIAFCLVACADISSLTETPTNLGMITETAPFSKSTVLPTITPPPSATSTPEPTRTHSPMSTPTSVSTETPSPTTTLVPANVGTPVHQPVAVISSENVDQLTELTHWGRGVINDVAYSENGRWIAVGTTTGVYIHDAQDLSIEPHIFETSDSVQLVDISLDGKLVAMTFNSGSIELWDVAKHQRLWADEHLAYDLQFSPDGKALAAVISFADTSVGVVWSLPEGEIVQSFTDLFTLQFSADSSKLAVWEYGELSVYDWLSGELLSQTEPILFVEAAEGELDAQGSIISDVQFGIEDEPILLNMPYNSGYGSTGRVEFQRGSDNALMLSLPPIELLSFPIQAACNEPVYFADPPSPPEVWQYELLPQAQIVALKYEDRGFAGDDKEYTSLRFHRLDDGEQLYDQNGINAFAFSPDGETWLAGLGDGRLQIRRIMDGELLQTYDGYESPVSKVIVSPDSQLIAVEYLDEVKLYRVEDGTLYRRYPAGRVAFAPDGMTIALGFENGRIEIRDTTDDSVVSTISIHTDPITAIVFSPSGDALITTSMDCQLSIWQLPNGNQRGSLENYLITNPFTTGEEHVPLRVWDMLITPDGETLVGSFLSSIGIWKLPDGTFQEVLEAPYQINDISLSSNGEFLAMANYPMLLWRLQSSGEVNELWQRDSIPTSVAFSPDGQLLLTGKDENFGDKSVNGAIQLHLAENGEMLYRLTPGTRKVTDLAFAPNGRFFVSSSLDGVIRLWGIP